MKTYQKLADYISRHAITRGATKGNAPVKRVVNSSREYIRYVDGEGSNIVGFMDCKHMFTMTPQGVLTVHGTPYECTSVHEFMFHALGLYYRRRSFKSVNHRVVNAAAGYDFYLVKDGMVFNPDNTVQNPAEFYGKRVNKAATATLRENLTQFRTMFALWLKPDETLQSRWLALPLSVHSMFLDTEHWEALCEHLAHCGYRKYIRSYWSMSKGAKVSEVDPRFYEPEAYIKEILIPILTIHEAFDTGVRSLPYNT